MNCEKFRQMLDNYENLTEEEKLAMTEHTSVCAQCREEFDFFMSVINLVKTLPEPEIPEDFLADVNKRIDAERKTEKRSFVSVMYSGWRRYSAIAACLVVAVVIGVNSDMLVSKMTPDNDGIVIVEEKDYEFSAPDSEDVILQEKVIITENEDSADEVKEASNDNVLNVFSGLNRRASAPTAVNKPRSVSNTEAPAQDKRIDGESVPAENITRETLRPIADIAEVTATSKPDRENIVRETPRARIVMATPEAEQNEPYTLSRSGYRIPEENSEEEADKSSEDAFVGYAMSVDTSEESADEGYAMAGRSAVPAIQSSGSIYISLKDADAFMSIMNNYITDIKDDYYIISAGSLSVMFGDLAEAGINYGNFVTSSSGGQIAFSVVFF